MATLLKITLNETGQDCQSCGHFIKSVHTVKLDNGHIMDIGCECIKKLVGPSLDREMKWAASAKREYKKFSITNETVTEYINRRITEKHNARSAWQAWQKFTSNGYEYTLASRAIDTLGYSEYRNRLELIDHHSATGKGLNTGHAESGYPDFLPCPMCQAIEARKTLRRLMVEAYVDYWLAEIEQRHTTVYVFQELFLMFHRGNSHNHR